MLEKLGGVKITDFHSHILPEMDDGSRSVEESMDMLKLLHSQGIDRVVLTPHFYPDNEHPDSFFARRSIAIEALKTALRESKSDKARMPLMCVGAEVAYFNGMSMYKELRSLCIEGTNVMLLEMPFEKWTDVIVNEVCKIQMEFDIQVVLAHVDRYYKYISTEELAKLKSKQILMQINADPFLGFLSGARANKLLCSNYVNVMGSDSHNMASRVSNMDRAIEKICSKGRASNLTVIMQTADELLASAQALTWD